MSDALAGCLDGGVSARLARQVPVHGSLTLAVERSSESVEAEASGGDALSCRYTGQTDGKALTLTAERCSGTTLTLQCGVDAKGRERRVELAPLGSTVTATTVNGRLAGTLTRIYKVNGGGELILGYALTAPAL